MFGFTIKCNTKNEIQKCGNTTRGLSIVCDWKTTYISLIVIDTSTWVETSCNLLENDNYTYIITNYTTNISLASTLSNYITNSSMNATLTGYTTTFDLSNLLTFYPTYNELSSSMSTNLFNSNGISIFKNELQLKNTAYNSGTKFWRIFQASTGVLYLFNTITDIGVFLPYGSTSWSANSDKRIKKNINYLTLELNKINKLKPCYYNYNQDNADILPRIGFIAQDVEIAGYQNLVSKGSYSEDLQDFIKGVDMSSFIPYIIKAIQEIDYKIENLTIAAQEQKIINLENEIINLKTQNNNLQTQITNLINTLKLKSII
jgi:hypothetical protein